MKNKLKKVISYAIDNGWEYSFTEKEIEKLVRGYDSFIWRHDFAKAVWKGKPCTCTPDNDKNGNIYHKPKCKFTTPDWRVHLQQAVISKSPINYYYEYVKEDEK